MFSLGLVEALTLIGGLALWNSQGGAQRHLGAPTLLGSSLIRRYHSHSCVFAFPTNFVCALWFLVTSMSSSKDKGSMDTEERSKPLTIEEVHAILDKTKHDILQAVEARIDDRMGFSKEECAVDNKESSSSEGMDSSMTKFGDFSMIFKEEEPLDLENDFFANLEPIFDEEPICLDIPIFQDVFHLNESMPIYDRELQEREYDNEEAIIKVVEDKPHEETTICLEKEDTPLREVPLVSTFSIPFPLLEEEYVSKARESHALKIVF